MRKLLILFIVFSVSICNGYSQNKTVKGRAISDRFEILPYVTIMINDTVEVGSTDLNGFFQIEIPVSVKKLMFRTVGIDRASIELEGKCDEVEVVMLLSGTHDFITLKKVDRLRMKKFKKLPEIHQEAFEKGIFKTDTACYTREFIPNKPQLDQIGKELKAKRKANKKYFKDLAVGDTIRIPYSGSNGTDKTGRTTLNYYSYVVDGNQFDCIIEGVILDKNRSYNGYNIMYKVTETGQCKYDSIIHEEREMKKGEVFKYNMKYLKVITE